MRAGPRRRRGTKGGTAVPFCRAGGFLHSHTCTVWEWSAVLKGEAAPSLLGIPPSVDSCGSVAKREISASGQEGVTLSAARTISYAVVPRKHWPAPQKGPARRSAAQFPCNGVRQTSAALKGARRRRPRRVAPALPVSVCQRFPILAQLLLPPLSLCLAGPKKNKKGTRLAVTHGPTKMCGQEPARFLLAASCRGTHASRCETSSITARRPWSWSFRRFCIKPRKVK